MSTTAALVTPTSDLPPAPPLDTWVVKGNDFQKTLDLGLQTELIKLGMNPAAATDAVARDLAYTICTVLRAGIPRSEATTIVQAAYPATDNFEALSLIVSAQSYCLDTVET